MLERLAEENRKALDDLYSNPYAARRKQDPAAEGRRALRRLASAVTGALVLGLVAGTYTLKNEGRDTPLAQRFDHMVASVMASVGTPATATRTARSDLVRSPTVIGAVATGPKPVTSVHLAASDAAGTVSGRIPLFVEFDPGSHRDPIAIEVSGLPEDARLSRGSRQIDGTWRLGPADRGDVYMVMSERPAQPLNLTVAAVDRTSGTLAAPPQEIVVRFYDVPRQISLEGQ